MCCANGVGQSRFGNPRDVKHPPCNRLHRLIYGDIGLLHGRRALESHVLGGRTDAAGHFRHSERHRQLPQVLRLSGDLQQLAGRALSAHLHQPRLGGPGVRKCLRAQNVSTRDLLEL